MEVAQTAVAIKCKKREERYNTSLKVPGFKHIRGITCIPPQLVHGRTGFGRMQQQVHSVHG